jgi:hypothetical protein|tara:strand:- start:132 stop:419 length:288 start_codon:yes stop_codon:yes gene_type:complete
MPNDIVTTQSINNVDITPVLKEVIEYSKDQASIGNIEELISKVPQKESLDWKLLSGVLCNSLIEWVAEDKDNRLDLIKHIQGDIGYVLKRMGLTM